MNDFKYKSFNPFSLSLILALALPTVACTDAEKQDDNTASDSDADVAPDVDSDDSGTASNDDPVDDSADDIGNPVGDPRTIDHATAAQTAEDNILQHMDGLQAALGFLEDSKPATNLVEMLFGEDEEEEHSEDDDHAEEEEPLEIDFSELRDGMVEMMADRLMVESTATVAEDGLSISYAILPELFCAEDEEEDESEEDAAERLENEAECIERLNDSPLGIDVMSDSEGDVNLTLLVGATPEEVLTIQLHDDQISAHVELPKIKKLVEAFVSPEDFELPSTMDGILGVEVRQDGSATYTARFAVIEDILVTPNDNQEQFGLNMSQADDPGRITFNGDEATINGGLEIDPMAASLPWQIIVDMFYDDEPTSEWICETNENDEEECWDEYTEPTEPPEVDEAFILDVAGVSATISYNGVDDAFVLTGLGLGDATTSVHVDDTTIINVDVNPDTGRQFDFTLDVPGVKDLGFIFSENFAL
jgi:hypothetical protein